jgi:ABC-type multidrug transport system fused ATPase/permease subunit
MIARVINLSVINTRLSKFLNAKTREAVDLDTLPPTGSRTGDAAPLQMEGTFLSRLPAPIGVAAIELQNAFFRWPGTKLDKEEEEKKGSGSRDKLHTRAARALAAQDAAAAEAAVDDARPPTLSNLNVQLKSGTLTAVIGPVGCGKTSLLVGILGDMPRLKGRVVVRGEVVYCAQEPWIQNLTLKDNILFGRPFDETLYQQVSAPVPRPCLAPALTFAPPPPRSRGFRI